MGLLRLSLGKIVLLAIHDDEYGAKLKCGF